MAYGSPNRLEDVEAYFTDIRGGRRPSREAVDELTARYRRVASRPRCWPSRWNSGGSSSDS